jgi:NADPH:quinone reductase-like Zn-dependent oxidoreductase
MQAILFNEFGTPDVLQWQDVSQPKLGSQEALVKVAFCGVNRLDLLLRTGMLGGNFPRIIGSEIVGTIVEVNGASSLSTGTRVAIAPWLFCGTCDMCLVGRETICRNGGIVGVIRQGGYGAIVSAPISNCIPIPEDVSFSDAAAITLSGLTAFHMLRRSRLAVGERILIRAASSGVSSIAIRLAKMIGAVVIAQTRSKEKRAVLERLGADLIVVADDAHSLAQQLKASSFGDGFEVVFDHLGQASWKDDLQALGKGGRYVTCGTTTGPEVTLDLSDLYFNEWEMIGCRGGTRDELRTLLQLLSNGRLRPVIDKILPAQDAIAAHKRLESTLAIGKLLLAFS